MGNTGATTAGWRSQRAQVLLFISRCDLRALLCSPWLRLGSTYRLSIQNPSIQLPTSIHHPTSFHPFIIQQTLHQLSNIRSSIIQFSDDSGGIFLKIKTDFLSFFCKSLHTFLPLGLEQIVKNLFSKSWYIFHCWLDLANIKFSRWEMFLLHTFNTLTMSPPPPLSPSFINHLTHVTSPTNTQQNTSQGWRSN